MKQQNTSRAISEKLVDGPGLLEILFAEKSRPSLRWLQNQQHKLKHVKIGRLVFFDPVIIRETLFPEDK